MLAEMGVATSSSVQWLPPVGATVWQWVDFGFFVALLGASIVLVVSVALHLLGIKGREKTISVSLLLAGGILWFAFAAFTNFIGNPLCKPNTFLEFVLFEIRPLSCSRGLILSYVFLLPVILVAVANALTKMLGRGV